MLLHTPSYLVFLVIVIVIYWLLPTARERNVLLLLSSYYFYGHFNLQFAALLFILTIAIYFLGKAIPNNSRAQLFNLLSVAINLSILGYFKYSNFFLESITGLLPGAEDNMLSPGLAVLLPVGISFYTFQGIAYTTEIYRKKSEPTSSFIEFALYMAFFPKLIAGPFVRPKALLTQFKQTSSRPSSAEISDSLRLFILGLFKKIVIADSLASISAVAFRAAALPASATAFPSPLYIQGFYLFAVEIYADFSGYTDMARASASFLGIHLPENFKQPYLASTVTDFWNRWHMTLTQWFREYLFFPITRNLMQATKRKHSTLIQISANLFTMLLIGLWHGASWTYIAWGLWHGILISIERLFNFNIKEGWPRLLSNIVTFHLVGFGWIMFRADTFDAARNFFTGLFAFEQMLWINHYLPSIIFGVGIILGIDLTMSNKINFLQHKFNRWRPIFGVAAIVVITVITLLNIIRETELRPFIYGQF